MKRAGRKGGAAKGTRQPRTGDTAAGRDRQRVRNADPGVGGLAPEGATADATATEHLPADADREAIAGEPLAIRSIRFLGGMASKEGWRPDNLLPEVAFAGRSNVGKSSLLNRLVRRKAIARVSRTPGRTREINFFAVNEAFVLVDLPGYGYARVSKERKQEWRPLMERYLKYTRQLRGVVQLVDARREPTEDDLAMLDFLAEVEVPVLLAVTKVDKLSRREVPERMRALALQLGADESQLIPFSAVTGEGRNELAAAIEALLATPLPGEEQAEAGEPDTDVDRKDMVDGDG